MNLFVLSVLSTFELGCGCAGFHLDVPGFGEFRVYESTCLGAISGDTKKDPVITFSRDETPVDFGGLDGEAKNRHEGPFLD